MNSMNGLRIRRGRVRNGFTRILIFNIVRKIQFRAMRRKLLYKDQAQGDELLM